MAWWRKKEPPEAAEKLDPAEGPVDGDAPAQLTGQTGVREAPPPRAHSAHSGRAQAVSGRVRGFSIM